jgi:enamine deaminase RidA (YjgF/YER057c/UK114 family)
MKYPKRKNITSGAPWEDIVGYSRAVALGNTIEVSGTVAVKNGELVGKDSLYEQTKCIFEIIEIALHQAGATMEDVVRTRIYVTDISRWEEVAQAHGERFDKIKPATTMVQVGALISPDYLVEIEATAIITERQE